MSAPAGDTPQDRPLLAEQVAAVQANIPGAALVSAVNAGLLALVIDDGMPARPTLLWLGALLAVSALRLLLWWGWRRDSMAQRRPLRWAALGTLGAALAGLCWGGGAALLWPAAEAERLLWVFVVGGMCTGAVALHHAHMAVVIAFLLPAALPIAAQYAAEGSGRGLAAAAMILVFLAALALAARRFNGQFHTFARLRRDLRRQARVLEAARAELRREVEEHRVTAASLHQAQKMEALGQLTGGIAHDFNNLLMAVLGSLALLRKRLPAEDARAARLLGNAVAGAERGAALTQRLLAFGRRQVLQPGSVRPGALLDGMAELLHRSIGTAHRLRLDIPPGLPPVEVDAAQLELALLNLAINARDAMQGGGEIAIAARAEAVPEPGAEGLAAGGYVVLSVTDHGIGMDAATLARATEPFFTTKGIGKGTGLGLSMADGLAAQSGGRLKLRSRPGEGTVAELWLRRAASAPAEAPAAAPAPEPSRPVRPLDILLVDDDPLVLASTAGMLEDLGHRVTEAEGGAQALARLEAGLRPDLVLTDYGMPGMSGAELAEALRRLRPGLPVILATGHGELPALPPAGVTRLRKPFGQAVLADAIAATLGPPA